MYFLKIVSRYLLKIGWKDLTTKNIFETLSQIFQISPAVKNKSSQILLKFSSVKKWQLSSFSKTFIC